MLLARALHSCFLSAVFALALACSAGAADKSISALDQHFNAPGGSIGSWMFVPQTNIKSFSTDEHPGLATIYEAGKGQDFKGILRDPIKLGDYRLPWEFQTSLVQSFNGMAGVGAKTQVNSAIGLNVVVTVSDPATWPADRTKRPDKSREFQLLVVHLGCTGEAGVGLPQFSAEPHPETYLVWGRGDLGNTVMGDWRIPYVWIGDGAKYGGPASPQLFFRCVLQSPTQLVGRHQVRRLARLEHAHDRLLGVRPDHRRLGDRPDHLGRSLDSRRAVPQPAAGQRSAPAGARAGRSQELSAEDDARRRAAARAAQSRLRVLRRLLRVLRLQPAAVSPITPTISTSSAISAAGRCRSSARWWTPIRTPAI